MEDVKSKIVALLHDVVEDTSVTLQEITEEFDEYISFSIDCLTRRRNEDIYSQYLDRVSQDYVALQVKIADMTHNSQADRIKNITEKDLAMIKKYKSGYRFYYREQIKWM